MTLQEVIQAADQLSLEDRKKLVLHIVETFPLVKESENPRDIREFRGMAAHLRDQDAQEYVNELRNEG